MTSEEFVKRVKASVHDATVSGTISMLEMPSGRHPPSALVELSQWFSQLSEADKQRVQAIIELATRGAVFGMLTVLDGERTIREAEEPLGVLELRYSDKDQSTVLNHPDEEPLHDIFSELVASI